MKKNLFSFWDYKEFLRQQTRLNESTRGYKSQIAKAAGCPPSYLSRVMNAKAHLSQEQAIKLAVFWTLSPVETEYFLELVNLGKTSLPLLTRRIRNRLLSLKAESENLSNRFSATTTLDHEKEMLYYSAWHWSAIHVLVGIQGFQTAEKIAKRLNISLSLTVELLSKMEKMGLVKRKNENWSRAPGHSHLSKDSPMIKVHHTNWREKAVQDSLSPTNDSLHYTLVQSHSQIDFDQIKQLLLDSLDKCREVMKPSAREEMTCLCLDFFRV